MRSPRPLPPDTPTCCSPFLLRLGQLVALTAMNTLSFFYPSVVTALLAIFSCQVRVCAAKVQERVTCTQQQPATGNRPSACPVIAAGVAAVLRC